MLSFTVADDVPYTAFDLSDRLRYHGWQVPAYTMPDNATDVAVLRIVVREGFSGDLGRALIEDITKAAADLLANPPRRSAERAGFKH